MKILSIDNFVNEYLSPYDHDDYLDDVDEKEPYDYCPEGDNEFQYEADLCWNFMTDTLIIDKIKKDENLFVAFEQYIKEFNEKNRCGGREKCSIFGKHGVLYYKFDPNGHLAVDNYKFVGEHPVEGTCSTMMEIPYMITCCITFDDNEKVVDFSYDEASMNELKALYNKMVHGCPLLDNMEKSRLCQNFVNYWKIDLTDENELKDMYYERER